MMTKCIPDNIFIEIILALSVGIVFDEQTIQNNITLGWFSSGISKEGYNLERSKFSIHCTNCMVQIRFDLDIIPD